MAFFHGDSNSCNNSKSFGLLVGGHLLQRRLGIVPDIIRLGVT